MQSQIAKRKIRRFLIFTKHRLAFVVLAGFILALFAAGAIVVNVSRSTGVTPVFLAQLLLSKDPPIKKIDGKTNVLLLGMAGGDHAGSDLADTIVVITIDFARNKIFTISIPRDIWVPSMKDKVNTAYHYGQGRDSDTGGFVLAKAAVEEVVGLPIHYIVRIDFDGFTQIINDIGGVTVVVEKGFIDEKYPIAGLENDLCDGDPEFSCRYETIEFEQGQRHLDGKRALKYVRSRNAEGDQGTDIARGNRQQQVLQAVKTELLSVRSLFSFTRNKKLIKTVEEAVDTDMKVSEMLFVGRAFLKNRQDNIINIPLPVANLVESGEGILINPPLWQYSGRWVLIPPEEDFELLHEYVRCKIEETDSCEEFFVNN